MAILSFFVIRALFAARSASAGNLENRLFQIAGNKTTLNEELFAGWNDNAISRGSSEILWSCIVTLTACIYTAIHLNIPISHRTKWQRLGAKVKWALMALIAPEVVVGMALKQSWQARKLCKQLNNLSSSTAFKKDDGHGPEESQPISSTRYELCYGFWVVMGGFVADVSSINDRHTRLVLSQAGVVLLAKEGHYLKMPNEQISDRSKANLLAKALVCAQVFWMLVQCIARKASGFPLTLLELHTMIHVACALVIYGLWWHKPLDVEEPVEVDCTDFMDLLALMLNQSYLANNWTDTLLEYKLMDYFPTIKEQIPNNTAGVPSEEDHTLIRETGVSDISIVNIRGQQVERSGRLFEKKNSIAKIYKGQALSCGIGPRLRGIEASAQDIRRWNHMAKALDRLDHLPMRNSEGIWFWEGTRYDGCTMGIEDRALNLGTTWMDGKPSPLLRFIFVMVSWQWERARVLFVATVVLPLFYGGIHLTAWHFAFATVTEDILWKVACVGIMTVSPLLAALLRFLVFLGLDDNDTFGEWIGGVLVVASTILGPILLAILAFCRIYIVLEAFLSLRLVPVGVYATVSWVQNIPHL